MAGQDYPKRLEAGATQNVNIAGDYIFCKFADRPFTVIMDGSRVTMEAGDKYRNEGGFKEFEIENTDTLNPFAIVLTIGQGDYNRQIVKGEVGIVPILRNADGTTKTDTRSTLKINLTPSNLALTTYSQGEAVAVGPAPQDVPAEVTDTWVLKGDGYDILIVNNAGDDTYVEKYNKKGQYQGRETFFGVGFIAAAAFIKPPGEPLMYLNISADITVRRLIDDQIVYSTNDTYYRSISYVPERDQYLAHRSGTSGLAWLDRSFQIVSTFTGAFTARDWDEISVAYDGAQNRIIVGSTSNLYILDETGALVDSFGSPVGTGASFPGYTRGIAVVDDQTLFINAQRSKTLEYVPAVVAMYDYTTNPEFIARKPGCELAGAFLKQTSSVQVSAVISATEKSDGVTLTGEIIKAALEFYYQRKMPVDYLDHVYALDLGTTATGLPFRAISSGNETFKRASIEDNFDVLLPGQILITTDNELTLGAAL